MKKNEIEKLEVNVTSLMFGGLIITSLVILQGLLSSGALDIAELISLSCLGLALPILAGGLVVNYIGIEIAPEGKTSSWVSRLIWAAMSTVFIGITAAIWHASWIPSVLFLATSIISFRIYYPSCRKMLQNAYIRATDNN